MIKYRVGNLIDAAKSSEINVIAHCTNCYHSMVHGIAPQLVKSFPGVLEADLKTPMGSKSKLGTYSSWHDPDTGLEVFNLYAQHRGILKEDGSLDVDYKSLQEALGRMNWHLKIGANMYHWITGVNRHINIGMPKLGLKTTGGDWAYVAALIENELEFDVYIYVDSEKDIPLGY